MKAQLDLLGPWLSRQRWFANRGAQPMLEEIGSFSFDTTEPGVLAVTHLLLDHTIGKPALYQVPLTYRSVPLAIDSVGTVGGLHVYDAPHDPAYTAALLAVIAHGAEAEGPHAWAVGHRSGELGATATASRVLSGEQSNTSIVFPGDDANPTGVIVKLFRALHDGDNPDVVLQTALALAGSRAVPRSLGHVVAEWNDRGEPSGRARGHLAFAQEFVAGAQDAWVLALSAAETRTSFAREAYELGIATAGVHATLAASLPTKPVDPVDIDDTIEGMHRRLAAAIAEVPALDALAAAVRSAFARAVEAAWPEQQRIHGDLHLGQVLQAPGRGWVLVDFEGEPLRPMRERTCLDSPLRDVAGMLRSFDYAAGSVGAPAEWTQAARLRFCEGYGDASGRDLLAVRQLLDTFEIDKALYETVYEARNRPAWLPIPVSAIQKLAARAS